MAGQVAASLHPSAHFPRAGDPGLKRMPLEQDQRISDVVKRERSRLRNFIRRRAPDSRDAEDILQDVFYELVEANRLLMPIEHVTGWLFRVARKRYAVLHLRERFRQRMRDRWGFGPSSTESKES